MRRWAVTDRSVSEQILEEQRVFAETLDGQEEKRRELQVPALLPADGLAHKISEIGSFFTAP